MPGAKKSLPAPIDRPLSRAYLRQFKGWSTDYPPGLSDPASLRIMENVMVMRDGSVKIRPGMRFLTYFDDPEIVDEDELSPLNSLTLVGTHEVFFVVDLLDEDGEPIPVDPDDPSVPIRDQVGKPFPGDPTTPGDIPSYTKRGVARKAYLFAARTDDTSRVFFYVALEQDDPDFPFEVLAAEDIFTMVPPPGDATTPNQGGPTVPPVDLDPELISFTAETTYVKYLQIDNKIIALSNAGEDALLFYVGSSKTAVKPVSQLRPNWDRDDQPIVMHPDAGWIATPTGPPTAETPDTNTLIDSTENNFRIGYFWTAYNEWGESAPSQVVIAKIARPQSAWEGSNLVYLTDPEDPVFFGDQLAIFIPEAAFAEIFEGGALGYHVYSMQWQKDESVPVEAIRIATTIFNKNTSLTIRAGGDPGDPDTATAYDTQGFVRHFATVADFNVTAPVPQLSTRRNYSQPSKAGNGLVAADRIILVRDPAEGAVIRWSSNQQGDYLNFSANRGGGYKTLTSGNLYIPSTVKLWQNPQSVDSLVIMCEGVDGMSTGYYMAPAEITSQSESTAIMGFEETSATPGTVSPYGCEVYSNALFHPLDEQLMKSTAANYAIRHKSLTDLVARDWAKLVDKDKIVSAEHDGRIYYIVHNPDGVTLQADCNGNEIWVLDAQVESPTWSRFLIQAVSLRKVELDDEVMMSVVRPEGIYALDPAFDHDEVYSDEGLLTDRGIPWQIETNTQGANRAHDAWSHVQLASIMLGNFVGSLQWGIRGADINGKMQNFTKVTRETEAAEDQPWDFEDHLQIRRQMKEWFFYAGSILDDALAVVPSAGQINLLQYRYTPSTVNTGYEFGSVETFEYGRDTEFLSPGETFNGVPRPFADTTRP
jgi:hypothetical protein